MSTATAIDWVEQGLIPDAMVRAGIPRLLRERLADAPCGRGYGEFVLGRLYSAAEFLDVESYANVLRWAKAIDARPAVKRGRMVNRAFGEPETQLRERHDASDFDTKTQDKIASQP